MKDIIKLLDFSYRKPASYLRLHYSDIMHVYKSGKKFISTFLQDHPELAKQADESLELFLQEHMYLFGEKETALFKEYLSQSGAFAEGGWIFEEIKKGRTKSKDGSDEATMTEVNRSVLNYLDPNFDVEKTNLLSSFASIQLFESDVSTVRESYSPKTCFSYIVAEIDGYQKKYGSKANKVTSKAVHEFAYISKRYAERYGPWFFQTDSGLIEAKQHLEKKYPNIKQVNEIDEEILSQPA